jgi:quercetin dioxygenase-like cupin family protein
VPAWDADDLWDRLVGDAGQFAAAWAQRPVVRRTGEDFTSLFGIDDAERLLASGLRRPAFRLVRDGVTLPDAACTRPVRLGGRDLDDVADVERITAEFADGATVVLQGLHRTHARVGAFAHALERTSGHPIQVNAYLTPPSERGLAAHSDAHDVLVLHVSGEKRWWVAGLGELTLCPGDVLSIPAGVEHEASAGGSATFHLTVGVLRVTLRQIVARRLAGIADLDRPAPLRFVGAEREAFTVAVAEALDAAASALSESDPTDVVMHEIERAERRRHRTSHGAELGVLASAVGVSMLHAATEISLRPGCELTTDRDGQGRMERHGRSLRVPAVAVPALAHLVAVGRCAVDQLPGLDDESRLVLARRLVCERFATIR